MFDRIVFIDDRGCTIKLKEYESILKLHEKREKLEKLIEKVSDDTLKNELNELF